MGVPEFKAYGTISEPVRGANHLKSACGLGDNSFG